MPILSSEPALFPQDLFRLPAGSDNDKLWWVVHTRPRQEKSLARQLLQNETSFFLPLLRKRNLIRGRMMDSHLPLFSGYLFLLGDVRDVQFALGTRRVARHLEVHNQQRLWDDLRQIQQLIESGASMRPENELVPGRPVQVQTGPLAGIRGEIVKSHSGNRFVVKIDFIQRGASVLLDEAEIAAI